MATHSNILAWRIPWTEESGGLQSTGHKESDTPVHGILQVRTLEWAAISFSRGSSQPRDQTHVSCIAG